MHIIEFRWHQDHEIMRQEIRTVMGSQDETGLFHCLYTDRALAPYANFMGWAVYQYYLVSEDIEMVREYLPASKRQIQGWKSSFGNERDMLLREPKHALTGKEYQPSFWYFTDFPDNPKDLSQITTVKRVDRAIYFLLNVRGTAEMCRIVGDSDEEYYRTMAKKIERDIMTYMWDENNQFFYDVHAETNEKAMVKNIVGFYPWWAGVGGTASKDGFSRLFSEDFNTACPFPSVSTDCPVFSPCGGWKKLFFKGRDGCIWNGPMWPYTNSVILDALACHSKENGHRYDQEFQHYFREFTLMHYENRDFSQPKLVEFYNSFTGEPLSGENDYNHSYYIDLIMRHIVGIRIEDSNIRLDPVAGLNASFRLSRLSIQGHDVEVQCDKGQCDKGQYGLFVDGKERQILTL